MLNLRRAATAGLLALVLGVGALAVVPAQRASAAQIETSGTLSRHVRTYDVWRTKTPGAGVYFTGTASKNWQCCGGTLGFGSDDYWALGLRNKSGTQVSRLTFAGRNASGLFPNTAGVTYSMVFAINTRAWGNAIEQWDSEAVATFSGTLNW